MTGKICIASKLYQENQHFTVLETDRKSLILQHCERSELRFINKTYFLQFSLGYFRKGLPLERKQTRTEPLLHKIMRLCSTICQHSAMFTYQKIEFPLVFVKVLAETDERVEYKEKETSSLESYIASKGLFFFARTEWR